jgi:MoaA/NifB/PqqE/SkfB family radical SAM enzyme
MASLKRVDIKTGYSCNNNCLFCILGEKRKRYRDKSTSRVLAELKEAKEKGFEKVVLTGGEVTIRKDFLKIVRFAKHLNYRTILVESNGRMFKYESLAKKAVEAGANSFIISIHASNPKDYAKLANTSENAFSEVMQGIKNLKKYSNNIGINCTINKVNFAKLREIVKLCKNIGIGYINFPFVNLKGSALRNKKEVAVTYKEAGKYLREALQYGKDNNIRISTEMIPLCYLRGFEECCDELRDKKMSIIAVDYIDKDFRQGIKSERVKSSACSKCKYNNICFGILNDCMTPENLKDIQPVR